MMVFLSHSSGKETRTSNRRNPGKISDRVLGIEPTFRPTDYVMNLVHDVTVEPGQAIVTPLMAMDQAVVIDSEEVEAGGCNPWFNSRRAKERQRIAKTFED
jgi:hypothetical protein